MWHYKILNKEAIFAFFTLVRWYIDAKENNNDDEANLYYSKTMFAVSNLRANFEVSRVIPDLMEVILIDAKKYADSKK